MDYSSSPSHNTLVSKILQVALGLFVTTSDLPPLSNSHDQLSFDCSFSTDCRWASVGNNIDRWRIGQGEPDSLLWLAATGTMQIPREPYALIESRGNPVDALVTDTILCQQGSADFSFTFWVIGNTDLEICLTDIRGEKFNCTGNLNSSIMPGKVSLKIPEMQEPFRIMIQPTSDPGVIVLDDIRFNVAICGSEKAAELNRRGRPDFMTTIPPSKLSSLVIKQTKLVSQKSIPVDPTTKSIGVFPLENSVTTVSSVSEIKLRTTTEIPFDLLIIGNKTSQMIDRRIGKTIDDSVELLCDFNNEFSCRWGPETGKWAIIQKGAIPSLEDSIANLSLLPTYPAGLVLQGTAMLASDPIRCQSGNAKVLFRYWSNGDILLQVCAVGYEKKSNIIHCFEQSKLLRNEKSPLAVFEMNRDINETFTLNIVPQWENGLKNRFLVIDEIAYIGECNFSEKTLKTTDLSLVIGNSTTTERTSNNNLVNIFKTTTSKVVQSSKTNEKKNEKSKWSESSETHREHQNRSTNAEKHQKRRILTTFAPVFPDSGFTRGWKFTKQTIKTSIQSTTLAPKDEDYCELLNCNFDDTACNYLNHGLTKKPWTLRNRGYGFPLTGTTDVRATQSNGQFVSTLLDTGDIAILESPKFNATRSLNVLLFQYFRPTQMTTIRLCLGSRHTNPMRTIFSFIQCPSILRSVTSKNAYRWNTVHIQLPPGTTHFYLVAHSSEKSQGRAAVGIDNMRVAICDTRGFAPDYIDETTDFENVH